MDPVSSNLLRVMHQKTDLLPRSVALSSQHLLKTSLVSQATASQIGGAPYVLPGGPISLVPRRSRLPGPGRGRGPGHETVN